MPKIDIKIILKNYKGRKKMKYKEDALAWGMVVICCGTSTA